MLKKERVILFSLLIVLIFLSACEARINIDSTSNVASTNWSKWGGVKITSDEFRGTVVWQFRTNLDTGEVQLRERLASSKGGYHKSQ